MGFFQWVAVSLLVLNLILSFVHDGEMYEKRFDNALTGAIIWAFILFCGGFFK